MTGLWIDLESVGLIAIEVGWASMDNCALQLWPPYPQIRYRAVGLTNIFLNVCSNLGPKCPGFGLSHFDLSPRSVLGLLGST